MGLVLPTARVDGRPIDPAAPLPFVAAIELPAARRVTTHTKRVARVRGWASSATGGPITVRIRWGLRRMSMPASLPRPEVDVATWVPGWQQESTDIGFDTYLDLPRGLVAPFPLWVSFSDGEHVARSPMYALMPRPKMVMLDTYLGDPPAMLELAAKHLRGRGVEFGALHAPVPIDPAVAEVVYADRLTRVQALATFFDMEEHWGDKFVDPEIIVDLDTSDLSEVEPYDFDFFIANGVIEHLANPLRFLECLDRVMKPGALFLLTVPDRAYAFDARRRLTPVRHLMREHRQGVSTVSTAHLREMVWKSPPGGFPLRKASRDALYNLHRERSTHVHVWNQRSFDRLLDTVIPALGLHLEVIDRATSREAYGNMVYVLRRT